MAEDEVSALTKEEAHARGYERILSLVANGGNVTKLFVCSSCGQKNKVDVPVVDADEHVRMMKYLDDREKARGADTGDHAQKLLGDLRALSDDELSELYVSLGSQD